MNSLFKTWYGCFTTGSNIIIVRHNINWAEIKHTLMLCAWLRLILVLHELYHAMYSPFFLLLESGLYRTIHHRDALIGALKLCCTSTMQSWMYGKKLDAFFYLFAVVCFVCCVVWLCALVGVFLEWFDFHATLTKIS